MYRRFHRVKGTAMILAPVAMLALGVARPAAADDATAPHQPSAIERLVQQEEARAAGAEVLRIMPQFSVERWKRQASWNDPAFIERWAAALHKAGLK